MRRSFVFFISYASKPVPEGVKFRNAPLLAAGIGILRVCHLLAFLVIFAACSGTEPSASGQPTDSGIVAKPLDDTPSDLPQPMSYADVITVEATGSDNSYRFSVSVQSPDTGCDQFADWWEVLSPDGMLLYRRVLLHSHVGEQPFTRSGGPVPILHEQEVIIRAHMNTSGYGGQAFRGSVAEGFTPFELAVDFAASLENQPPLPKGCNF